MNLKELSITYIATAVGLLLAAGLSGAFGGLAILNGGMLGAIPGSNFISMHLSLGHLGWAIMAIIGLYLGICYLTDTKITYGFSWFKRIYWIYLVGILSSIVLIALGYGNDKRYGETTWPVALLLMATVVIFFVLIMNLFRRTNNFKDISIYYFLVSVVFICLYFGAIALPLGGIAYDIALNLSTHLLFDGMMLAVMGLSVYILPKIVGRPLYSEMLAFIQIWMVLTMVGLTGSRHVVRLNIMSDATEFWAFFYNSLAAAFICVYFVNLYLTVRGARPQKHKFSFWALIMSNFYLGIVAFQGLGFLFMSIYQGKHAAKMLVTLHAHFALFGFVTLGLVGGLFYILPKMIDGFNLSDKLSKLIFYTLNAGMLLAFTATALENIAPAEAHFADHLTTDTLQTYYLSAQYVGDTLLLVTSFLIGWAIYKNLVKVKLPLKRLAVVVMLTLGLIAGNWWPAPFNPVLAQAEGPLVAVANEGDGTVSIINGVDGKVVRVIKTGGNPHNVNFDPLGRYLWVTDHSEQGRVLAFGLQNFKQVGEIPLAGAAGHVVPSYDGRRLYVSVEGADHVLVVDTETFQVIEKIETDVMPHGLVIAADESVGLVPNMMSDTVTVMDFKANRAIGVVLVDKDSLKKPEAESAANTGVPEEASHDRSEIMSGHEKNMIDKKTMPAAMGITPSGDKAYVSLAGSHQVAEIDVKSRSVTRVVEIPGRGEIGPIQLPVHPNGKHLYVPSTSEGKVFKIDLAHFKVLGEITTGAGAHGIAYAFGGRYAYVTNTYDNTVSCIDTLTDEIAFVETVGNAPNGVAVLKGKNQGW